MSRPIYSLVRVDTVLESEDLDYSASSAEAGRHEEALLVDESGLPSCKPTVVPGNSYDEEIDYGNGNITRVPVANPLHLSLRTDYLSSESMLVLQRMKQDRALVQFTPGFGNQTDIAWRPLETTSASISDLTGQHTLTISGDATRDAVWRDFAGPPVMLSGFDGKQRIIRTPAGAGQVFERGHENIAGSWTVYAGSPSTETITGGFGHTDAPDSLRYYGTVTAGSTVTVGVPFTTVAGDGTLNASFWISGRVTKEYCQASLSVSAKQLGGNSYPEWTRIDLQDIDTYSAAAGYLLIALGSVSASSDMAYDFEVGPAVVVQQNNSAQYSQTRPTWQTTGAAKTADYLYTSADFRMPPAGSMSASFFVPEWFEEVDSQLCGICGADNSSNGAGQLIVLSYSGNTNTRLVYQYNATSTVAATVSPLCGEINTACVVWGTEGVYLYFNGELVSSVETTAASAISVPDEPFLVGRSRYYDSGAWPFVMLGVRVDREVWSADRVAQEHKTLTDPFSASALSRTRGRYYYIESIPEAIRQVSGYAFPMGNIVLRQASYHPSRADMMSAEVY